MSAVRAHRFVLLISALTAIWLTPLHGQQSGNRAMLDQWMKELSNWGRWGEKDQIGAVNLITPEVRRKAAALVKDGVSISLSRNTDTVKAADNATPFTHIMTATGIEANPMFTGDTYTMTHHGASLTHLDALSHMVHEGRLYNGYSKEQVNRTGAHQLAVDAYKTGLFSRGILMDIPRLKGVKFLEISTPIYASDLEAWEKKAGVRVRSGDIVFVRTGRWARREAKGPWDTDKASAGLHVSAVRWLKNRDVEWCRRAAVDALLNFAPEILSRLSRNVQSAARITSRGVR